MMKKILLNISAAAIMFFAAIDTNASNSIDKDNNDNRLNTRYSSNIFYYPAIEHIITDENAYSQLSLQNENMTDTLSQLPNEVKLHVLQQLSVKDIMKLTAINRSWHDMLNYDKIKLYVCKELSVKDVIKLAATNHSWHNILDYSEISQAIAIQRSHPATDLYMSDLNHPILKSTLAGTAKLTLHPEKNFTSVCSIKDNGNLVMNNDSDNQSVIAHQSKPLLIKIVRVFGMIYTDFSSNDGMVHAGTVCNDINKAFVVNDPRIIESMTPPKGVRAFNDISRAYITTDLKTIEILKTSDKVYKTVAHAISADGSIIIGQAFSSDNSVAQMYGFIWTKKNGMRLLLNSKETLSSNAISISHDANTLGGCFNDNKSMLVQALVWTKDTRAFPVKKLLSLTHYPEAENIHFCDVMGFSPNSKILWGSYMNDLSYKRFTFSLDCSEDEKSN